MGYTGTQHCQLVLFVCMGNTGTQHYLLVLFAWGTRARNTICWCCLHGEHGHATLSVGAVCMGNTGTQHYLLVLFAWGTRARNTICWCCLHGEHGHATLSVGAVCMGNTGTRQENGMRNTPFRPAPPRPAPQNRWRCSRHALRPTGLWLRGWLSRKAGAMFREMCACLFFLFFFLAVGA